MSECPGLLACCLHWVPLLLAGMCMMQHCMLGMVSDQHTQQNKLLIAAQPSMPALHGKVSTDHC